MASSMRSRSRQRRSLRQAARVAAQGGTLHSKSLHPRRVQGKPLHSKLLYPRKHAATQERSLMPTALHHGRRAAGYQRLAGSKLRRRVRPERQEKPLA